MCLWGYLYTVSICTFANCSNLIINRFCKSRSIQYDEIAYVLMGQSMPLAYALLLTATT